MSLDHLELPLSHTTLTATEACGGVCPSYYGSRRQHQIPADWPSPLLRFMAPARAASPKPSARRPAPRSSPPMSAA
jgi:hypothetical protein